MTNAGVTSLMMAIESGSIKLVALCLNSNLNPFLRDALDRSAMDYTMHFRDILGHDMRNLIQKAMEQWMRQTDEEERLGGQMQYSDHYNEFKQNPANTNS